MKTKKLFFKTLVIILVMCGSLIIAFVSYENYKWKERSIGINNVKAQILKDISGYELALSQKDYTTAYEYLDLSLKQKVSYENFIKDIPSGNLLTRDKCISWIKFISISNYDIPSSPFAFGSHLPYNPQAGSEIYTKAGGKFVSLRYNGVSWKISDYVCSTVK